jgi:stage II sporulation protein D
MRVPRDATSVWPALLLALLSCTRPVTPIPVTTTIPVYTPAPRASTPAATNRPGAQPRDTAFARAVHDAGEATIRVLLSTPAATAQVASPAGLIFSDRAGGYVARAAANESWRVERARRRVRLVRPDGSVTDWVDGAISSHPLDDALLSVGGKPYRGDMLFVASDSALHVVNVVQIDDYLRGVVPLEIGTKSAGDSAAVQAQAVTARSYAFIHLSGPLMRAYDVTAGTLDQVYGGVAAETPVSSEAVESTRTLVLKYAGRVVNAPYHSTCGGSTAAASEIWRSNDEPYLQPVSDKIPGTGRYYCDISPRFRWTRTMEASTLNAALARYLASYVPAAGRQPGIAQRIAVTSNTASGRVGTLAIVTDKGEYTVRGNDIRYVLRPPGGEILNSTYFTVLATPGADGSIARLTIEGNGYGHGVGMCQWGAIGRARAGQDFRTILNTYYPGTTVGSIG